MSTPGTIKRRTPLTGTNNPAYQVSKDVYNDSLVIASAAANNSLMARDATQADGWGFLTLGAGLAVVGGALTAAGGAAAGLNTQVLFNDAGANAGDAGLTYNKTTATLTAGIFAGSGASLTNLPAAQLTGTIADAVFPATLPALSGVNLTALNATQLTSGTIPDGRFPATLPAISGANLTGIPETAIADGALLARLAANETVTGTWTFNNAIAAPSITRAGGDVALRSTGSGIAIVDGKDSFALRVNGSNVFTSAGISIVMAAGTYLSFGAGTRFNQVSNGLLNLTNAADSAGIGFDVATDSTIKIRTRAQSAYGTLDCLGLKASGVAGANFGPAHPASITIVNGIVTACS